MVQQWASADTGFQPIMRPTIPALLSSSSISTSAPSSKPSKSATTPSHSQQPTALPLIQAKTKFNGHERIRPPIKYEDNIFTETKRYTPKVVRYTKRRDAPAPPPKRPIKRYHHSNSRSRRRPKPSYSIPPNFGSIVPNPINEFSLAGDIHDPAMYKLPGGGRASGEKIALPPGVVDTDIGKFYEASAMINSNQFKQSYKPFGTSLLSPTSLFGGSNDFKLGEPNPVLTHSESSPSGIYPASQSNFDASNFNLYQQDAIYPTAPQQSQKQPTGLLSSELAYANGPAVPSSYNNRPSKSKKPLPPSTSYGVPVPSNLNTYAIESSQNAYQIPLQPNAGQNIPTGGANFGNNVYIPTNNNGGQSTYETNPNNQIGSSSNRLPIGHFAEPPGTGDNNEQPQSQFINFQTNQQNQYVPTSFDAPYQFQIQQTKKNPISAGIPSSIAPHQSVNVVNEVADYDDDQLESSTNTGSYSQPVLPASYDQEEFEAFTRQRRKILRQQQQQQQQEQRQKTRNRFEEIAPFFESVEENVRVSKKPKKRPTPTPATPSDDEAEDDYDEAPDEDYLDEIVGRPTKRTTRYKKKRPRTTSSPHVLDTDDLRDAFSSGSVKYSMAVKPDDMGTTVKTFGGKPNGGSDPTRSTPKKKTQTRKKSQINIQQIHDDTLPPQIRAAQRPTDKSDQFNIISIEKSRSQTLYDGTATPSPLSPIWHSISNYKPPTNSIQSRYDIDQRFDIHDVIRKPIASSTPSSLLPNHNYNRQFNYSPNNHKYDDAEYGHDRADVFDQSESQADNGIGIVNEESTVRSTTTAGKATQRTTLWDGKTILKNHKMN